MRFDITFGEEDLTRILYEAVSRNLPAGRYSATLEVACDDDRLKQLCKEHVEGLTLIVRRQEDTNL